VQQQFLIVLAFLISSFGCQVLILGKRLNQLWILLINQLYQNSLTEEFKCNINEKDLKKGFLLLIDFSPKVQKRNIYIASPCKLIPI